MKPNNHWQVVGRSVRGASHLRAGLPNQDAVNVWSAEPASTAFAPCAAAAVADGHGGHRHFRSDVGARFVVEIATRAMRSMARTIDQCAPADRAARVQSELPAAIVGEWVAKVRDDLSASPIRDDEWATLIEAEGEQAADSVRLDPLLAYGATLLAAIVTPGLIVLLQLGDGDVLCVSADNSAFRPVPSDERLNGNRTTSMCRPGAEEDFRIAVLDRAHADPALILMSTDGYANSFRTDDDFMRVGTDFAALIAKHGLAAVEGQLETILEEASAKGSGDDITLALLQREGAAIGSTDGAPLAAPRAAVPDDLATNDLEKAHRQIVRLRVALAAALVGIAGLGVWFGYPPIREWRPPKADLGGPPKTPIATLRDPGLSGSSPASERPPLAGAPSDLPKAGPKEGAEPAKDGAAADTVAIGHPHAVRSEHGVQVSGAIAAPAEGAAACTVRAAVWGTGEQELGAASAALAAHGTGGEMTLLVPYPAEKARLKAMRTGASEFSLRVDCAGRTLGKTERLPIDA
jgi:serine/threonine protein phosphatase PrpC